MGLNDTFLSPKNNRLTQWDLPHPEKAGSIPKSFPKSSYIQYIPSRELTYLHPRYVWRLFPFLDWWDMYGYISSLEGIYMIYVLKNIYIFPSKHPITTGQTPTPTHPTRPSRLSASLWATLSPSLTALKVRSCACLRVEIPWFPIALGFPMCWLDGKL